MKISLMELQTYWLSGTKKSTGFYSLIANLNISCGQVKFSLNMKIFVLLIEPFSKVNLSIFSDILSLYFNFKHVSSAWIFTSFLLRYAMFLITTVSLKQRLMALRVLKCNMVLLGTKIFEKTLGS